MYDPNFPATNAELESLPFRTQFQGLKALIDAVPAGPQGPQGIQGPPFANAVMDSVTTLAPGTPATGSVSFDGTDVHFAFGIPTGPMGPSGTNGTDGVNGTNGADGAMGLQGPPGEVTLAQLNTAINGTSNTSNGVATLDSPFVNDPPTLADLEMMRAKVNELIVALRR